MDWIKRFDQQVKWTAEIRQYIFSQIRPDQNTRILEVGCGPGSVLVETEHLEFKISCGLDKSIPFLQQAKSRLKRTSLIGGDATHLPFVDSEFGITYCHYFLLWVDSIHVLEEMRRITCDGGWIIALAEPDYLARIDYPPPLDKLGRFQTDALKDQGATIDQGRSLNHLFLQAGLTHVQSGFLGMSFISNKNMAGFEDEWLVLKDDLESILPADELKEFQNIDYKARQSGDRILCVPTFYAVGQVKK